MLIAGIVPYFLEKNYFWFKQNFEKILKARKTNSFWQENTFFLEINQIIKLSEFLKKLDELGYEKVWETREPGEFSQRGGIVNVFPINLMSAVRIEFMGNKIINIKELPIKITEEKKIKEVLRKKLKSQKLFSDLKNLRVGDYVVHLDHGIGKFQGYSKLRCGRNFIEYYTIEYKEGDKLYVPLGLERKLTKYIGFSEPKISRLGTINWLKTKKNIKEKAEVLARELIKIYAKREIIKRPPYLPEDEIDKSLQETFPFEETPDQIQAMEEIKKDLESEKPMDRLLCGDVGFGKTEIALRTMVKAVKSGYQAAMLCPTTILANQHYKNFKNRLKNLPIKVGLLSRFQTKKEQKKIIQDLKSEKIDIIVGTHRLLSNDLEDWLVPTQKNNVEYKAKGLGLLVIDDEHKFGVKQKEKLKKIRSALDVLSLSATPIPRTLYMALSSLKTISLIQTPPATRKTIKTFVAPFRKKIVKEAIERELNRGGQVYYLHNQIGNILAVKKFLENLVPNAKFGIAHGKIKEKELVKTMQDFQDNKINILITTTIIEAGLDLPNVNTLIVSDATKLGLSQAYQIRGRVGRSFLQAFAYFLYPHKLTSLAKKRLKTLKEAEEVGSGYKIALKDLELRGAGNILGKEQSGNINKVGLNLYCQILSQAIERLKE